VRRAVGLAAAAIALSLSLTASATVVDPTAEGLDVPFAVAMSYDPLPLSSSNLKERRVGQLIFRGGLVIGSKDPRFGGWSGLIVSADGSRMISQSDEAHWFISDLLYDASGNLSGLRDTQLADMADLNGKPMAGKEGDAEGLTALTPEGPDGPVLVSFERNHRVWRYDLTRDEKPEPVTMPDAIKALEFNSGLEGLTMFRPHSILAVAETAQSPNGDHPAWLVAYDGNDAGVTYGALGIKPHAPYEISDAAMGPDGNLYLLERHYFGPLGGVVIAVREIDGAAVAAGARLEGHEIAQFTMHENIDNMEGLSLRRGADGKILLYMISDDNYDHALQRTVLLMFELAPQ